MKALMAWLQEIFGFSKANDEYVERFVMPKYHRLVELGLTSEQAHKLVALAIDTANIDDLPGARINRVIDAIENGLTYSDCVQYLHAFRRR